MKVQFPEAVIYSRVGSMSLVLFYFFFPFIFKMPNDNSTLQHPNPASALPLQIANQRPTQIQYTPQQMQQIKTPLEQKQQQKQQQQQQHRQQVNLPGRNSQEMWQLMLQVFLF